MKKFLKYNPEQGNAIIWILIAVGLFAALGFTMAQGSRSSTSNITNSQTTAYAHEIIAYGNTVKSAVKRLKLRGCKDTQISFENSIIAGYTNPNAPSNKTCHIFETAGGGVQFQQGPTSFAKTEGVYWDGKYSFLNGTEWDGNGTTCGADSCVDLIMIFYALDEDICNIINKQIGYNNIPEDTLFGGSQFIGSYTYSMTLADEALGSAANAKKSACFLRTNDSAYIYVQTLLSR